MQFKLLNTLTLPLNPQIQWLWHSGESHSFIAGDDRRAFSLPVASAASYSPLAPARPCDDLIPPAHPNNCPIPAALEHELAQISWHGFRFLETSAYDKPREDGKEFSGDLVRTLSIGADYGHYLLHPASGLILSLRSGSMELLQPAPGGLKPLDKTKTRGRAAMAFAAHPTESLIAYGDNYGTFHAHRFDASGFGKATKIAAKERNASRVEFVQGGGMLIIGGMGYLSDIAYASGKFTPLHNIEIPVRDFVCLADGKTLLVNQGMHGLSAYQHDQSGFTKIGAIQPPATVGRLAISDCGRYLALAAKDAPDFYVYSIAMQ